VGTDSIPSPQPLSRRERGFLYPLEKLPLPPVKSDPELFGVVRRIRRVAFDAPRRADRLPGQCRCLNATYTHMTPHAVGSRGPRVKCRLGKGQGRLAPNTTSKYNYGVISYGLGVSVIFPAETQRRGEIPSAPLRENR